MLSELQLKYLRQVLKAQYIIEYDFSYGFPCEYTRKVLEMLYSLPSWRKGLASRKLIAAAEMAWRPCIDLQLFLQLEGAERFNPFTHEVLLSVTYVGRRFEDLIRLIPDAYKDSFPKLSEGMPTHVIAIREGGIVEAENRNWNEIFTKIPNFIMEVYYEKKIKPRR